MTAAAKQGFVSTEACEERHAATKWVLGVLLALVAVFLTGAVYAVNSANDAMKQACSVSTTLQAHLATQMETDRYLKQQLEQIQADIRENRVMLHELLRNGRANQSVPAGNH